MKIHAPDITGSFDVLNDLVGTGNISSSAASTGSFGRVEASTFSGDGSGLSNLPASYTTTEISGSWQGHLSGSSQKIVGGGVSGSATSTGSFGHIIKGGVDWDTAVSASAESAGFGSGGGGGTITALNNATANELVTVGATTTELDAEANLTFDGSTLTVTGDATITGDITIDDGGSLKEAGGTAAITFDGSGHVTKIGQDSPSDDEVLTWDGSKWVASSVPDATVTGGSGIHTQGSTIDGVLSKLNSGLSGSFSENVKIFSSSLHIQSGTLQADYIVPPGYKPDINTITYQYTSKDAGYSIGYGFDGVSITTPYGLYFTPDGKKLFVLNAASSEIFYEFQLKTPWDVRTMKYLNYFNVQTETGDSSVDGFTFRPDGKRVYFVGAGTDGIVEEILDEPFDISGTTTGKTVNIGTVDNAVNEDVPVDIEWKPDGTRLYIIGTTTGNILQYAVTGSTFDIGSLQFEKQFDISGEETGEQGFTFDKTGTNLFVVGNQSDEINQYHLSHSWDIGTATHVGVYDTTTEESDPYAIFIKPDNSQIFISGKTGDDISVYTLSSSNAPTTILGDVSVEGSNFNFKNDSYVELSGSLKISDKADVKVKTSIDILSSSIKPHSINTRPLDISTFTHHYGAGATPDDISITNPSGLAWRPDGKVVFIMNAASTEQVHEFHPTTPWDLRTLKHINTYTILTETSAEGFWMHPDGTEFHLVGATKAGISKYSLSQAWDLTTVSYVKSINLENVTDGPDENNPHDIIWRPDGKKVYVAGQTTDAILQYAVTGSAFDIGSLQFEVKLHFPVAEQSPTCFEFNADGSIMLLCGNYSPDTIYQYNLSKNWEIGTANFVSELYIGSHESSPLTLNFKPGDNIFYVGGTTEDGFNVWSSPYYNSGSYDLTTHKLQIANDTNIHGDLDVKGDLVLRQSPKFQTAPEFEYGLTSQTGSIKISNISNPIDISTYVWRYNSKDGGYASSYGFDGVSGAPVGLFFRPDGRRMFVLDGSSTEVIYQYTLKTPFDVRTQVKDLHFTITNETNAEGFTWHPNGKRIYLVGSSNDGITEIKFDAPYDISNQTVVKSINLENVTDGPDENDPKAIEWKPDGTKVFILGTTTDSVLQYNVTGSAFDIGSLQFEKRLKFPDYGETVPSGMTFTQDGSQILLCGTTTDTIYQYNLSKNWDIGTAIFVSDLSVTAQESSPEGLALSPGGDLLYIVGKGGDDINVYSSKQSAEYRYQLTSGSYASASAENFPVDNEPSRNIDIFGNTDLYGDLDVKGKLILQQPNTVDFKSPIKLDHGLTSESGSFKIKNASISKPIDITKLQHRATSADPGTIGDITDITFRPDGKRVILSDDYQVDKVYQFNLAIPWDVSSLDTTSQGELSVSSQESNMHGMTMSVDGRYLFIVGHGEDGINSYSLTTPWDITTASALKFINVENITDGPNEDTIYGMAVSTHGEKFYTLGTTLDSILQYAVTGSAFDIGSLQFEYEISMPIEETAGRGMTFTHDGSQMFIVGGTKDEIYQYDLSKNWDIGTAVLMGSTSVSSQESGPTGLYVSPDHSRMYVVGTSSEKIHEYGFVSDTGQRAFYNSKITGSEAFAIGGQVDLFGSLDVLQDINIVGHISQSSFSTASFGHTIATTFAGDGASLTNVPDYVYESTYELRTINELEEFVTENKHLPNVPDMTDMDKWKTLSVSDRDMLLLEKIEELSLYIIELNKRIEKLENNQE